MAIWEVGSNIGHYHLQQPLTMSGLGSLWQGVIPARGRVVWLQRIVRQDFPWVTARQWEQFQLQAEELPTLSHANIISYRESLSLTSDEWCLVMEAPAHPLDAGPLLSDWLLAEPQRTPAEAEVWSIWQQLVKALQYLHSRGWVHGTLSPDAIALQWYQEKPKVLLHHIGVFHLLPPTQATASDSQRLLPYLPPEERQQTSRTEHPGSDIYALGGILWFLLTGSHPPELWQREPPWSDLSSPIQDALTQTLTPNFQDRVSHCRPLLELSKTQEIFPMPTLEQMLADVATFTDPIDLGFSTSPQGDTLPYMDEQALPDEDLYNFQLQHDIEKLLHSSTQEDTSSFRTETSPGVGSLLFSGAEGPPTLSAQHTLEPSGISGVSHQTSPTWDGSDPDLPSFPDRSMPKPIPSSWEQDALREDQHLYQNTPSRLFYGMILLLFFAATGYFFLAHKLF